MAETQAQLTIWKFSAMVLQNDLQLWNFPNLEWARRLPFLVVQVAVVELAFQHLQQCPHTHQKQDPTAGLVGECRLAPMEEAQAQ